MKSVLSYLKIWSDDFTASIYLSKILGLILTLAYFIFTLNKDKAKYFNRKNNYFLNLRQKLIQKYIKPFDDKFNADFLRGDRYDFNGVYLPKMESTYQVRMVYDDLLKIYTEYGDNYDYKLVDELDKTPRKGYGYPAEGSYCYVGPNGEDITIKKGNVVIDAWAWIGDFSAYCSKKGSTVYAFEPYPMHLSLLEKTVQYNAGNGGSIFVVPFGLGDNEGRENFQEYDDHSAGSGFGQSDDNVGVKLNITTLDAWVEKNNIPKVDFIKADIEGYERKLLAGAVNTLKKFAPILSLCTYHLPDDFEVLSGIILKANPRYKIIQRKMKLFAYV